MDSFYNLKLLKSILFKEIPIISFEKNKKLYLFRYFNKYLGFSFNQTKGEKWAVISRVLAKN